MSFLDLEKTNPATETDRVRKHTARAALEKIDRQIEHNIRYYTDQPAFAISKRIRELEAEWSTERWLEANASALAFSGTLLGLTVSRRWLAVPLIVTGFLFQHAVQGWCPPMPILRRKGVRTRREIDREKYALKALRGDFKDVSTNLAAQIQNIKQLIEAARAC